MTILEEISLQLQNGNATVVRGLIRQALAQGLPPTEILEQGLLAGMGKVSRHFDSREVFVAEVLVAARAMNAGTAALKPLLTEAGILPVGKVCIGTVQGDLHDIGKNLVKMMMEARGLEVIDLGTDVPPERYVEVAREEGCKVIVCSALLTTTMGVMQDVVEAAEKAGIRDQVKIMVGGMPITVPFCEEIGADCYTADAAAAADAAVELCREAAAEPAEE